jgi:hypothetical protein
LQQQGSKCVKPKIEKRKIELVGDMQHWVSECVKNETEEEIY